MSIPKIPPPAPREFHFTVGDDENGLRLDRFLKARLDFSRSQIQRWIELGAVVRGRGRARSAEKVQAGEAVRLEIPEESLGVVPEDLPLDVIYEDEDFLAVHKPAGMVAHPASAHRRGTLANALAHHIAAQGGSLQSLPPGARLGLAHRLDKETSGVVLAAKHARALDRLARQFEERSVRKAYRAIVAGPFASRSGEIEGAIGKVPGSGRMGVVAGGRFARTEYKVLKNFRRHAYLEIYPKTGRTHQIRVHLARIGHPVLGDKVYSKDADAQACPRHMLHAYRITVRHPMKNTALTFSAPLPDDFQAVLRALEKDLETAQRA